MKNFKVVIKKREEAFFKNIHKEVSFQEDTNNTLLFYCCEMTFVKIMHEIKSALLNPNAMMTWESIKIKELSWKSISIREPRGTARSRERKSG